MTATKYLFAYSVFTALSLLAVALLNFSVDPYQLYRGSAHKPVYFENQRYQMPGLAKHYDYDTVVIGTSMTENFYPSYVDKVLEGKTLKLSIQGSTSKEQRLILEKAIQSGKVKNVIWGLDLNSFSMGPDYVVSGFPMHMYREDASLILNYLLSLESIVLSLKTMLGIGMTSLENLNTWDKKYEFSERRVAQQWLLFKNSGQLSGDERSAHANRRWIVDAVQSNLELIVKENQNIDFYLYYPPRSILYHTMRNQLELDYLSSLELFMRSVFESVGRLNNVGVYDFQADKNIIFDLSLYKDTEHHNLSINELIVDNFKSGDSKVSFEEYNRDIWAMRDRIREYQNTVCRIDSPRIDFCVSEVYESGMTGALSGVSEFNRVLFTQNVEVGYGNWGDLSQSRLKYIDGILVIEARGTDPSVHIPYEINVGEAVVLKMEINSPLDTIMEVFYQTEDSIAYSADRSVSTAIYTGNNVVIVDLSGSKAVGKLRLDPGRAPGEYLIKSLEVLTLNEH